MVASAVQIRQRGLSGACPVDDAGNAMTGTDYELVAASQTNQAMGATGAAGDYLAGVLIIPATVAGGIVSIKDGSNTAIPIYVGGGTTALATVAPFYVQVGAKSTSGAWQITTGANISAIGFGNFT